ncbi:sulfotransferase family protein [Coraliomargarita sinensis]|uniref:Sulfotransferase family protein n=1 Tax=Coraliomargarita sinensis TaxID=2174842 RepID=A0A317ZIA9_9BACT|nr:sulfotransferase [Coraliomargarita sinensis]PXA03111.1 sulfotransferase family protein [Coraliomargarita sinensis]
MDLNAHQNATPARQKRLHIVGCPRSGTTLMMELMAACIENDGRCEHEMSIFQPLDEGAELFFSKKPTDIRYIRRIFLRDPDLYLIALTRDPRSVISSIHKSISDRYFVDFDEWAECQKAADALKGHDRFLLIKYEELTQDPNGIQQRILSQFPFLKSIHPFTEYTNVATPSEKSVNALNGVRAISTSRHDGWKMHLPRIKSQLVKYPELASELIRLGYEKDDSWMNELNDMPIEKFSSRHNEYYLKFKRLETSVRKFIQSQRYLKSRNLR